MPRLSKVGDGWGGAEDYADIPTWWAAEAAIDYGAGNKITALGKGYLGIGTVSGSSVNGALIYTDGVLFNGANSAELAIVTRLNITAPDVIATHLKIVNNNAYSFTCVPNGLGAYVQYCFIDDTSGGSYGAVDVYGTGDGKVLNCVIKTNSSKVFKVGYNRPYNIENCIVFGCTGTALSASGSSNQIARNNFFFGNAIDYGTKASTFENNASQDATGSAGLTNFTSAELVDFLNGDYRTKSTSMLATAGTTGSYIGAFIEQTLLNENYEGAINASFNAISEELGVKSSMGKVNVNSNHFTINEAQKHLSASVVSNLIFSAELVANKKTFGGIDSNVAISTSIKSYKSIFSNLDISIETTFTITGAATEIISKSGNIHALNFFLPHVLGIKKSAGLVAVSNLFANENNGYKSASASVSSQLNFAITVRGVNDNASYTTVVRTLSIYSNIIGNEIYSNIKSKHNIIGYL